MAGRLQKEAGMKRIVFILTLLVLDACVRKAEVRTPKIIRAERYFYTTSEDGHIYIVTSNIKDFDEAMKVIRPGPASVDKLDLWVVTPAPHARKETRHSRKSRLDRQAH